MARVRTRGGIEIDYEVAGAGEPVLLLMGLGTSRVFWPPAFVDVLHRAGYATITIDNRDVGLSTFLDGPAPSRRRLALGLVSRRAAASARWGSAYGVPDMALDALAVLDELGIRRAHLVGLSMGGMIVQQMAIDHPDRTASLCSIMSHPGDGRSGRPHAALVARALRIVRGPAPVTPEEIVAARLAFLTLVGGPSVDEAELRFALETDVARRADPSGTMRQLLAIGASPDRTDGLRTVRAPTLVMHGLDDLLVRPSGGIATARAIPDSRLLLLEGMGHGLPTSRRVELAEAVVANARRASLVVDRLG